MANYLEWNTRIIQYFISSVQEGQGLYLTINEDVLAAIDAGTGGSRLNETLVEDFQQAVRDKVITDDGSVNLAPLNCFTSEGEPMGVAFLAAQVLTAFRMADDVGIDETNYFSRLRDFLGIPANANEINRPSSMSPGSKNEKPLWDMWGRWLQGQGFVDTAEFGEGARRYVSLPISQSLVRQADKDKLTDIFGSIGRGSSPDKEVLFYQVSGQRRSCTQHLRELLDDPGPRYEALLEEIYDTWLDWSENGPRCPGSSRNPPTSPTTISLKLYRTEDPLEGVQYYFYPEVPRRIATLEGITVDIAGATQGLRPDRPGWYAPLSSPVAPKDLDGGRVIPADGHRSILQLRLEPREFWVLVRDPDDPGSGVRASWRRPILGETFTLLFRDTLLSDLVLLKDEVLIDWKGTPEMVAGFEGWLEVSECSAVSTIGWTGVFTKNEDLLQALRPIDRISIGLSGGIRLLDPLRWLASHPPEVSVISPDPNVNISVLDVRTQETIFRRGQEEPTSADPFPIQEWLDRSGDYQISARVQSLETGASMGASDRSRRAIKLVDWEDLEPALLIDKPGTELTSPWGIFGAVLSNSNEKPGV